MSEQPGERRRRFLEEFEKPEPIDKRDPTEPVKVSEARETKGTSFV